MPTYILATKLAPNLISDLSQREKIGETWLMEIKSKCPDVKWITHYAVLGPYDFIDIFEAPDEETALKVSMITLSFGASVAETWTAFQYKRFLEIVKEIA